ncbi:MAG TPA: hypothetical protein VFZ61_21200, partial [Polyangiales bacterium]
DTMATITLRSCSLLLSLSLVPLAHAEEPAKPGAPNKPAVTAPAPAAPAAPTTAPTSIAPVTIESRKAAAASPTQTAAPDVSALSGELSAVMDELIQARTRASVLAKSLFRTRIDIKVLRRADDQQLVRIKLALDGMPIHDSDGAALRNDEAQLFSGFVAPGTHEISLEITEQAKENPTYRYTRSERFRIETKKHTSTQVDVLLRDNSDMAEELPEGDDGKYDVSTRVRVTPIKVKE